MPRVKPTGSRTGSLLHDLSVTRAIANISITQKTTIYQGTAADAILNFPSNVNVASILAIAGVGMERTKVTIVADPALRYNQHQIIAEGTFGKLDINLMNYQAEGNPKTSFLAILSAIETVRSASRRNFRIGT